MSSGLVSVITPCYNAGHLVHRLFDSILSQTYPHIEVIAVNDGSTDNTAEVIKSYSSKFEEKGYKLIYLYQENQGQSAAVNNGLKLVRGEFLVWPDSDDWFRTNDAIESMVKLLEESDDSFGVVRSAPTYVDENTLREKEARGYTLDVNQFTNCLYNESFFWGAGNYMVKVAALDNSIQGREIYVAKDAGQNWQLLLPVLYNYKCITSNDSYLNVLERGDSHSRGMYADTFDRQMLRIQSYEDTVVVTLERIQMEDEERSLYLHNVTCNNLLEKINISIEYKHGQSALEFYKQYKSLGGRLAVKRIAIIYILNIPVVRSLYMIYNKNVRHS